MLRCLHTTLHTPNSKLPTPEMASSNPNRLSAQLSPFESPSGRQSPFRRQNSQSPGTAIRTGTPASSPTKASSSSFSHVKTSSLSPEKSNPFTRRPSQINHSHAADRPTSPFARPTSSLSIVSTPSRKWSNGSLKSPVALQDVDTPTVASPSPFDGARDLSGGHSVADDSPFSPTPVQALSRDNLRPAMQRNITSSTTTTIKPPTFTSQAKSATPRLNDVRGGTYNHLPQPLLHSMRESFEVLDSNNTGTVNSAAVADMLAQLGLDNNPAALTDFFPPTGAAQLNLARYLDVLSGPLSDLSEPDELQAAFEAFDVDDSGQIDVAVLRDALLHTASQPGDDMVRMSEREVDGVLREFAGRRAFGAKGMHAGKPRGEVFRYRDFMANVSAGGGARMSEAEAAMAA